MIGYLALRTARGVGPMFGMLLLVLIPVALVIQFWYVVAPAVALTVLWRLIARLEDRRLSGIYRRLLREWVY